MSVKSLLPDGDPLAHAMVPYKTVVADAVPVVTNLERVIVPSLITPVSTFVIVLPPVPRAIVV